MCIYNILDSVLVVGDVCSLAVTMVPAVLPSQSGPSISYELVPTCNS